MLSIGRPKLAKTLILSINCCCEKGAVENYTSHLQLLLLLLYYYYCGGSYHHMIMINDNDKAPAAFKMT